MKYRYYTVDSDTLPLYYKDIKKKHTHFLPSLLTTLIKLRLLFIFHHYYKDRHTYIKTTYQYQWTICFYANNISNGVDKSRLLFKTRTLICTVVCRCCSPLKKFGFYNSCLYSVDAMVILTISLKLKELHFCHLLYLYIIWRLNALFPKGFYIRRKQIKCV